MKAYYAINKNNEVDIFKNTYALMYNKRFLLL